MLLKINMQQKILKESGVQYHATSACGKNVSYW